MGVDSVDRRHVVVQNVVLLLRVVYNVHQELAGSRLVEVRTRQKEQRVFLELYLQLVDLDTLQIGDYRLLSVEVLLIEVNPQQLVLVLAEQGGLPPVLSLTSLVHLYHSLSKFSKVVGPQLDSVPLALDKVSILPKIFISEMILASNILEVGHLDVEAVVFVDLLLGEQEKDGIIPLEDLFFGRGACRRTQHVRFDHPSSI